ncbi:solute carrier family 22 member 13-like isoform X1 [Sinocyclocheilus grahami]|uniref:solute carrier family 22 member 13-like isoform X1 n=1 Tax=Sinocyclocheilus grahami TaxID=75366 RepID=UPI0007ACFCCA|nr:PREDICTED: solute carrier family 22 member 13-like isoform X1 [Sinocyclocheilus grahami]
MDGCIMILFMRQPLSPMFGRKRATQIPMVLMLIFTVVTGLAPNFYVYLASQFIVGIALGGFRINSIILGNSIAVAALATCGRFLMNGAGSICNVYIQELFPTSIRQTAMGLGASAARVASMLAPVVNMLEVYHFTIPTLVLGSLALASGITAFLLPETRHTELPGSTEEAEGKRQLKMAYSAPGDCEDIIATKL